ncbi:MAG: DUF4345 family protein [Betaproteobacteria bacterium]
MKDSSVYLVIIGFSVMGLGALVRPVLVTAQFGILDLTPAGRNEIRAVYGGFGILVAVALLVALRQPVLRDGILFTVAAALAGMAAGRAASVAIDRTIDRLPLCYLVLEVFGAVMLGVAA